MPFLRRHLPGRRGEGGRTSWPRPSGCTPTSKGKGWNVDEVTLERACEKEWVEEHGGGHRGQGRGHLPGLRGRGSGHPGDVSPVSASFPGLNTSNMGAPEEQGVYMEKCGGCGDCVLHLTGGICPVARCSKTLMNGPCGGSQNGKCEIDPETPCAWDQIYHSLRSWAAWT